MGVNGKLQLDLENLDISFDDCGDDLATHYSDRFDGKDIDSFITGECDDDKAVAPKGYRRASISWTPFLGIGTMYHSDDTTESDLRSAINADPDNLKIIRRRCRYCTGSHQDIYYKRLTPVPGDLDLLNIFKQYWYDVPGNEWHVDFELYSTYKNAKEGTKPWSYCSFNHKRRIPFELWSRSCRPQPM